MVSNVKDVIAPCPVCGRRLKIRSEYLGQHVKCRHCHGQFMASRGRRGGTVSEAGRPDADPRLRQMWKQCALRLGGPAAETSEPTDSVYVRPSARPKERLENRRGDPSACRCPSSQPARAAAPTTPALLLVEHRDEVYARLAADLAEVGFKVVRATSALQAIRCYAKSRHALVVANLDLPDLSGWLLAGKLHFTYNSARIWLYKPRKTATDVSMAKFLRVDELLEYGGDLLGLSDTIVDCVTGAPRRTSSALWSPVARGRRAVRNAV